jgi:hypothetical protein
MRTFLSLPAREQRLAVVAAWELTRASLELRLRSRTAAARLGPVSHGDSAPSASDPQLHEARLIGRAITLVAHRLPWHPTCLRQALAAQRMLRRRGIGSELHLGVTGASEAGAHAWVTVGGEPVVGGQGLERFVPLAAFR